MKWICVNLFVKSNNLLKRILTLKLSMAYFLITAWNFKFTHPKWFRKESLYGAIRTSLQLRKELLYAHKPWCVKMRRETEIVIFTHIVKRRKGILPLRRFTCFVKYFTRFIFRILWAAGPYSKSLRYFTHIIGIRKGSL